MDWTAWIDKADQMISKYGADVTVRVVTRTGYSAASDDFVGVTDEYGCKALITNFSERDIDKTLIQVGDKLLIIPAKGLPALDDEQYVLVVFGSKVWNPISIVPLMPGGSQIFYRIHVRG